MKKTFSLSLVIILGLVYSLSLIGCSGAEQSFNIYSDKLKIVTTIFPYYDMSRSICDNRAELKVLLSAGNEPHSYDPSPADIVAIENCDVFIYNGGESDEWVENILNSLQNSNIKIVRMMDYVNLRNEQETDHSEGDEIDEHIWTSPINMVNMSRVVKDIFLQIDENNSDFYSDNQLKYENSLKNLDSKFRSIVEKSAKNTIVFGDRFPFLYFVNEYDLDYECAFPGCSSETEPSIATVKRLIDYVRDENINSVLFLEFSNGRVAKLIAEDSKAKIAQFYSCHNITREQFINGETYISLMEHNAEILEEALG